MNEEMYRVVVHEIDPEYTVIEKSNKVSVKCGDFKIFLQQNTEMFNEDE